jgi:hypothetical protein
MTSEPVELLIVRPRGGGKTTEAIRHAAATGAYIVCPTMARAREIWQRASIMGLKIPFPLTGDEFFGGRFHSAGCRGFVLDDLDHLLRRFTRSVPLIAATWTADPEGDPDWTERTRRGAERHD